MLRGRGFGYGLVARSGNDRSVDIVVANTIHHGSYEYTDTTSRF